MLPTNTLMPEDTEQMAPTLNSKKQICAEMIFWFLRTNVVSLQNQPKTME